MDPGFRKEDKVVGGAPHRLRKNLAEAGWNFRGRRRGKQQLDA